MAERTPRTIAESGSAGAGVSNNAPSVPEQAPDAGQAAPGGAFPSDAELPVVSVIGGPPATLGGYSPDPNPTPMTSNVGDPLGTSYLKAPEGIRK
jgi:hypothetical protein